MEIDQFMINYLVYLVSCMIACAMILWGLKLYKFYIVLAGVVFGALLGLSIGMLVGKSQGSILTGSIIVGFALGFLGGLFAWPLQKFLIFLASGISAAFFGVTFSTALGIEYNSLLIIIIAILFFIIGFILAINFYKHVIIIIMAFAGAQSIFNLYVFFDMAQLSAYNLPILLDNVFSGNIKDFINIVINSYKNNLIGYILTILLFIIFAYIFQLANQSDQDDDENKKVSKNRFVRITYLFTYLSIFSTFSMLFLNYFLEFQDSINDISVFGINIISWPIIVLVTSFMINFFIINNEVDSFISKIIRHLIIVAYGIIVIPFLTSLFYLIFSWPVINPIKTISTQLLEFYQYFLKGPVGIIVIKWIYSILIFPLIFYLRIIRPDLTKPIEIHDEREV